MILDILSNTQTLAEDKNFSQFKIHNSQVSIHRGKPGNWLEADSGNGALKTHNELFGQIFDYFLNATSIEHIKFDLRLG